MLKYKTILMLAALSLMIAGCSQNDIIRYQSAGGMSLQFVDGTDGVDQGLWPDAFSAVLTITAENDRDFEPLSHELNIERHIDGGDTSFNGNEVIEVPVGLMLIVEVVASIGSFEWEGTTYVEILEDQIQTIEVLLTEIIVNHRPDQPYNPFPADGATGLSEIFVDMFWSCDDPDGDPLTYDIQWGETILMANSDQDLPDPQYFLNNLNQGTTYYWQVTARDTSGAFRLGPIWEFTTTGGANNPPYEPSNPLPAHQEANVAWDFLFMEWVGGDPDGDPVTYDIYYGDTPAMTNTIGGSTVEFVELFGLTPNTRYFWQVLAMDDQGGETWGPVWEFETAP